MSDAEDSPAASPSARRHEDESANAAASPKSPRAESASPKSGADDESANVGRRATSRSPSPVGGAAAAASGGAQAGDAGAREPRAEGQVPNPGNNLYVANLPVRVSQMELEDMFAKFGRVEKCEVISDPVTRESRGFGFVSFEDIRDANDAVAEMNGKEIQGRRLRVEHAKRQRGHEKTPGKYLGPRQASTKYGFRPPPGRSRSRSRDRERFRPRSRSRSRGRRYDSRDRYDRRYDDRRGGYDSRDRYDRRSRR